MAKAELIMDLAYKAGSYKGSDGGDKAQWVTIGHIKKSTETGNLFCVWDTLALGVVPVIQMMKAGEKIEREVLCPVFLPREDDKEGLAFKVAMKAGTYEDRVSNEKKPEWETVGRCFISDKGRHYFRVRTDFLNPVIVMQLLKAKEDVGREVFLSCFMEKLAGAGDGAPEGPEEKDEIPF